MEEQSKYKKRIHLKGFSYMGCYKYFVTICTFKRKAILTDKRSVEPIIDILKETSRGYGFAVWAYCFMPDHAHFLFEGKTADSDLKKFISMFKQRTAFWYSRNFGKKLWQINYYEHVLRKDEEINRIAQYILLNPVRRKMVQDYRKFPFSGSFVVSNSQP
jgi:putative transposase